MSDTQYWMAEPGGNPEGPYDVETLRSFAAQGRMTASTQLCPDGGTTWQPASSILGHVVAGSGGAGSAGDRFATPRQGIVDEWSRVDHGSNRARPFDPSARVPAGQLSLTGPIIATVLGTVLTPCFSGLILGIIAIVSTTSANDALRRGDLATYESKAQTAKTCVTVTVVLIAIGCILNAVVIGFMGLGGIATVP